MVTGEPVSILQYLKFGDSLSNAFVLAAFGFLIVVDSSMAIIPEEPKRLANHAPTLLPLADEKASTFITNILTPGSFEAKKRLNSSLYFLVLLACQ